jgi:hypothetical protein
MLHKQIKIIKECEGVDLELVQHQNRKYFVRYGFAATDLHKTKELAIEEGYKMLKDIKKYDPE